MKQRRREWGDWRARRDPPAPCRRAPALSSQSSQPQPRGSESHGPARPKPPRTAGPRKSCTHRGAGAANAEIAQPPGASSDPWTATPVKGGGRVAGLQRATGSPPARGPRRRPLTSARRPGSRHAARGRRGVWGRKCGSGVTRGERAGGRAWPWVSWRGLRSRASAWYSDFSSRGVGTSDVSFPGRSWPSPEGDVTKREPREALQKRPRAGEAPLPGVARSGSGPGRLPEWGLPSARVTTSRGGGSLPAFGLPLNE